MQKTRNKNRMFKHVTTTWNPIVGCLHNCKYCWARRLAETKLRHLPQYRDGFTKPKLVEAAFKRRFKPGDQVFVSDMGDMWGAWVPDEWIKRVLDYIRGFPDTTFLFLTKNPGRYLDYTGVIPGNVVLGVTIETNRPTLTAEISDAPSPILRYQAMAKLDYPRKLVSIEPILSFDHEVMVEWIRDIDPEIVYVGYDNYGNMLIEPPLKHTLRLVRELRRMGYRVEAKTLRKAWYEIK